MSLRSAVRIAARPRALPAVRSSVPRRFASSSPSSHKPAGSSNAVWAAGSAVVFGGMAAFILMPSKTKDHVAHQQHPHEPKEPGEVQFTKQEVSDNIKNQHVEDLAKKSEGNIDYKEIDEAKEKGLNDTNPPKSVAQGDKKAPVENPDAEGKADESSKTESTDAGSDESSGGYEPTQKEITASIVRGERTDAPPVAESEEEKGIDVQAKKD